MAIASTTESAPETVREPGRTGRRTGGRRRGGARSEANGITRFFLAKTDGRSPLLDREIPNEKEALLESLKTGQSYFAVSEWKAVADLTRDVPQIRKEAVKKEERDHGLRSPAPNARGVAPAQAS
jgi:hypothetical protein